jgi:hypothetical protein
MAVIAQFCIIARQHKPHMPILLQKSIQFDLTIFRKKKLDMSGECYKSHQK